MDGGVVLPPPPVEFLDFDLINNGVARSSTADFELRFTFTVLPSAVVPVPAAVWLVGSGLIGLIGVARRKSQA